MSRYSTRQLSSPNRAISKLLLSGFVVFSFVAYVIHQQFSNPDGGAGAAPAATQEVFVPMATLPVGAGAAPFIASMPPLFSPTLEMPPTAVGLVQARYRDGRFAGPEVDAYYGLVRVQATIQDGRIIDVQFLDYPNDRRTSVRINSIAMPYLQQEALQVQSANVDIISGATLTSEAFIASLQSALATAKN